MAIDYTDNSDRLLRALAEQLKLPLLQIARQAELGNNDPASFRQIRQTADTAMQLIDGLILSTDVHAQGALAFEPVSVASVLHATYEDLLSYAKAYGCELELKLEGKYSPVMGDFNGLRAAFTTLGYSLIEAQQECDTRRVSLVARRTKEGINAGVFGYQDAITTDALKRARALLGTKQPFVSATATAGAGIFIADAIFNVIATPLEVVRHNKFTGLATTLLPSQQLRLV